MIYKCAGCDFVLSADVLVGPGGTVAADRARIAETNYKKAHASVTMMGLCPVCALANVKRALDGREAFIAALDPGFVNGRKP